MFWSPGEGYVDYIGVWVILVLFVYDRKGFVIFRTANIFLMLEVIYMYMKHIHPDFGIEDCRSRSQRK